MFATDPGSDGPGIKTKVIQFADAAGSLLELFQDSTRLDPSQSLLSKTSHHLLHDLTSTLLLKRDVFSFTMGTTHINACVLSTQVGRLSRRAFTAMAVELESSDALVIKPVLCITITFISVIPKFFGVLKAKPSDPLCIQRALPHKRQS
ncbi:hypothetical protein FOC1_g10006805 [Fusarium oxysporum f. sp. cubense race 1]|uniref:Uncharacterized protein n=1 Tax=Fusarium oxysporum f. sp. cubense (strain race 1) TaxID=1229664 RepID=N4U1Y9_FUSC1|nr:hypothetical protein FOC1_g10006805 [Fusarium oxysporum f. sp. cubense race 1]